MNLLIALLLVAGAAQAAPVKRMAPPPPAAPAPAAAPVVAESSAPEVKFTYGANINLENQYFPTKLSPFVNQELAAGSGEVFGTVKVGRGFLVKVRPTGRWDPLNNSKSERLWGDVPEGYVQGRLPVGESVTSYTLVGFNTYTWGVTDGFNPVDVVNARRFNDPLRSEKLGAFTIMEKIDFGGVVLEGIYIPRQRKSTLPGENSRWLPRELTREQTDGTILFRLPANHTFYYREDQEYDDALKHNIGVRLATHVLGMDTSVYFFNGAGSVPAANSKLTGNVVGYFPGKNPDIIIDAVPAIGLKPIFYRQTVWGASLVFPFWEFLVKMEGAHTKPTRHADNLPGKQTEAVVELEHTFTGEKSTLTVIALGTYADHEDPANTRNTTSFARLFDGGAGFGIRYSPFEFLQGEFFTVFDTKYGSRLHKAEITKGLGDHFKIYAGGEIFAGKITTPVGVYRNNDRVIAGVKISL